MIECFGNSSDEDDDKKMETVLIRERNRLTRQLSENVDGTNSSVKKSMTEQDEPLKVDVANNALNTSYDDHDIYHNFDDQLEELR